VRIPPAVANELAALTHSAGSLCIKAALSDRWLVVPENPWRRKNPKRPVVKQREQGIVREPIMQKEFKK
jgi:hypothetical protein